MTFKNYILTLMILILSLTSSLYAGKSKEIDRQSLAIDELKSILIQNKDYMSSKGSSFFNIKSQGQSPKVTLVSCSDSRVHTDIIDNTPEGDLFIIRNIGNQISTARGSVKYGVNHLHSPLLLIVGHSQCGAIITATKEYGHLELGIVEELDTLHVNPAKNEIDNIKMNVNEQVAFALKLFKKQVENKELLIVGAVYDFTDEMKQGAGRLNIINVQGKSVNNSNFDVL